MKFFWISHSHLLTGTNITLPGQFWESVIFTFIKHQIVGITLSEHWEIFSFESVNILSWFTKLFTYKKKKILEVLNLTRVKPKSAGKAFH